MARSGVRVSSAFLAHRGQELEGAAAGAVSPESPPGATEEDDDVDFDLAIRCGVNEAFADGVNSGFYVNRCSAALWLTCAFCAVGVSLGCHSSPNTG